MKSWMLRLLATLVLVATLSWFPGAGIVQGDSSHRLDPTPDPRAQEIAVRPPDIPDGFVLTEELPLTLEVGTPGSGSKPYSALMHFWQRNQDTLTCLYAILSSRQEAGRALRSMLRSMSVAPIRRSNTVGDVTFGIHPEQTLFVYDRALVYIVVHCEESRGEIALLSQRLQELAVSKLQGIGMTLAPSADLRTDVISKHVDRKTDRQVELRATMASAEMVPVEFLFRIVRKGGPDHGKATVYSTRVVSPDGRCVFSWNGLSSETRLPVENGAYVLYIVAHDLLKRTVTAEVDVEVNE